MQIFNHNNLKYIYANDTWHVISLTLYLIYHWDNNLILFLITYPFYITMTDSPECSRDSVYTRRRSLTSGNWNSTSTSLRAARWSACCSAMRKKKMRTMVLSPSPPPYAPPTRRTASRACWVAWIASAYCRLDQTGNIIYLFINSDVCFVNYCYY